ncbi:hypothetical protein BpHYR1_038461 [Brachionus plicatilis]|uniref:Uncharacterized protein n=1 Tax=Brachionus plicatilis TaxID=10195 RepID=A0A3M7S8F4_BRAPC|nr:hypothetical protein BpHYR1_038461 [Brachionus plicatilis]
MKWKLLKNIKKYELNKIFYTEIISDAVIELYSRNMRNLKLLKFTKVFLIFLRILDDSNIFQFCNCKDDRELVST